MVPNRWRPPAHIRDRAEEEHEKVRRKYHIIVQGEYPVPPITNFRDMKLPQPVLDYLESKKIRKPSPIQLQGLPVA